MDEAELVQVKVIWERSKRSFSYGTAMGLYIEIPGSYLNISFKNNGRNKYHQALPLCETSIF